jgi:hypothetical protein
VAIPRARIQGASVMAKFALCVGINNYPGTGSDLSGCVNDAKDWGAALRARGFLVTTLLDQKATGAGMRAALNTLMAQGAAGDTLVFQYSGHGSFVDDIDGDEPDGTDECLCPHDIATKGALIDDELFQIYSKAKPGVKVVVISDSCHSGSVSKFMKITTPKPAKGGGGPVRKVRFLPPENFLSKKRLAKLGLRRRAIPSSPPGVHAGLLMAGCQDTEFSFDAFFAGRPNGAFSFVALRALKTLKPKATYADWFRAIRKELPSQQYPQRPNLFGTATMKQWKALV